MFHYFFHGVAVLYRTCVSMWCVINLMSYYLSIYLSLWCFTVFYCIQEFQSETLKSGTTAARRRTASSFSPFIFVANLWPTSWILSCHAVSSPSSLSSLSHFSLDVLIVLLSVGIVELLHLPHPMMLNSYLALFFGVYRPNASIYHLPSLPSTIYHPSKFIRISNSKYQSLMFCALAESLYIYYEESTSVKLTDKSYTKMHYR